MAIREGAWDCPACGRKGLPGSRKHCGGCGAVRGDDVQFYLPEGARVITDEEEKRRALAGPDWKCPYCGGDNPSFNGYCSGCGSPADGTEKRATKMLLEHQPPSAPDSGDALRRFWACCALLVLLFFAGCWFLGRTTQEIVSIESMQWQHTIDVEVLGPVTKEGWKSLGEVPADARVLSSSRQVREHRQIQTGTVSKTRMVSESVQTGTRQVKVGTQDLGNGYFEDVYSDEPVYETRQVEERYEEPVYRQEPVYDQRVRYEVVRWSTARTVEKEGRDNNPVWPAVEEHAKQRAGARESKYTIILRGDKERYTFHPKDETTFRAFKPGQTVEATVGFGGSVSELRAK